MLSQAEPNWVVSTFLLLVARSKIPTSKYTLGLVAKFLRTTETTKITLIGSHFFVFGSIFIEIPSLITAVFKPVKLPN